MPNNAPALNSSASPALPTILENATNPAGISVADLVVDGSITDGNGAVEAIAITALNASLGAWQYSLDSGTRWLTIRADLINSTTNELALLLGPTALLRLLPFAQLNGTLSDAITFRAWDQSTGAQGDYTVITTPGLGSSAFSAVTDTASLTVTAVNSAPTFALATGTGKVVTDIGTNSIDSIRSITVQSDGKILVGGTSSIGLNSDFAVTRYNADGSLDTSFNTTGKLLTDIGTLSSDQGNSITVQSDGKILVGGYSKSSGGFTDFAVTRYNPDGSLDTSFNTTGKVLTDFGSNDAGHSITVQSDGKILVGGTSYNGGSLDFDFAVTRYNPDGSLDTSFNTTGKVLTDIGTTSYDEGNSITVQSDGKILVGGNSRSSGGSTDFALARYNPDGSLDTSFNTIGKVVTDFGTNSIDVGRSITMQSDGKILVGGYSGNGYDNNFAVARYNPDGTLDTSFNTTGRVVTDIGTNSADAGNSITVQSDGKILVGGYSRSSGGSTDFAVTRYNPDGSLDTSFNSTGKVVTHIGTGSGDGGASITVQSDGKILVGGYSGVDFAVTRYNPDGSLDTTFGATAGSNTLGGTVSYTQNTPAVALDTSVTIYDADLAALNGGAGNYAGASVTLSRTMAVSADDVFSPRGNLRFVDGDLVLSVVTVGTFTRTAGTLTLTFNSSATQARVNEVLSSIAYANSSNAPPASVQIDWTLSDGNSSAQGSGGALTAVGSTTVTGVLGIAQVVVVGTAAALADFTVADPDGAAVSFSVSLTAINGTINGLTDADANVAGIQLSGSAATINTAIAAATFTATAVGAASVDISVSNGIASAVTATYNLIAAAPNDAPVLDTASSPALPTIPENATNPAGISVADLVADGSITDGNGAVEAIAITALNASLGAWQYSPDSGANWLTIRAELINSTSNELTLLLGPAALLRLLPFAQLNGTLIDAITFRAWDQSSGVQGDYTVITTPGMGTSAFSAATDTASLTVTAVNSAPTFAPATGTGKVVTDIGTNSIDSISGTTVQSDGKILVGGTSAPDYYSGSAYDFALVRYNADGSLDTSFNTTGKVLTDIGTLSNDEGNSITVQSDGKILVGGGSGSRSSGGSYDFALARYNPDGSLDTSFNTTGKVVTNIGNSATGQSITVQSDGKILVGGTSSIGLNSDFAVTRYNADGSLDTSFNTTGKLLTDIGTLSSDQGNSITVQSDGKILVGGYSRSNGGSTDFALARYNPDGSLDTSFNTTGKLLTDIGTLSSDQGNSITVQSDGKILLGGWSNVDFAVIRYNADGSLDTSFNTTGKVVTDISTGSEDFGYSITVQSDGKILVGGPSGRYLVVNGPRDFAVVRYNVDGSLDTSFNTTGKVVTDFGPRSADVGTSITVQSDGKILVGGSSAGNFAVARYNTDGSLDTTFGATTGGNTLGGTVAYTQNAPAVALDTSVAIFDADLAALNGGAGNYAGASVTLSRSTAASVDDVFSPQGNLKFVDSNLVLSVVTVDIFNAVLSLVTVGTFTQTAGTLTLTFNSSATQARVNEVLSSIAYANSSNAPPAIVQIDWTLSDGNSSAQGRGGALTAVGSTTVNITAPAANGTPPTDTDGTSDAIENAGPGLTPAGGGTAVAGDGNADGIPDSQQSGVTSVPLLNTVTPVSNPGSAAAVYVTLVADAKDGKIDTSDANSATFSNVRQLDAPVSLPINLQMRLGLLFSSATVGLSGVAGVGVTETFSLYADASLGINGYFKQTTAGAWVNLANSITQEGGKTRLDFSLTDGGEFDADHLVDGTIMDIGALGIGTRPAYGLRDKVLALYIAYFDRAPDVQGLQYWVTQAQSGQSLKDISAGFAAHPRFVQEYGGLSSTQIAAKLYLNFLHRPGDAEGLAYWARELQTKSVSDVVVSFTATALAVNLDTALSQGALTVAEYTTAYQRQKVLEHLMQASEHFMRTFGATTTPAQGGDSLTQDPAYLASQSVLNPINSDLNAVYNQRDQLVKLVGQVDAMQQVVNLLG